MHSRGVNRRQTFPTAFQRSSYVRATILCSSALSFGKAISMGFGSRLYLGRISAAFALPWAPIVVAEANNWGISVTSGYILNQSMNVGTFGVRVGLTGVTVPLNLKAFAPRCAVRPCHVGSRHIARLLPLESPSRIT